MDKLKAPINCKHRSSLVRESSRRPGGVRVVYFAFIVLLCFCLDTSSFCDGWMAHYIYTHTLSSPPLFISCAAASCRQMLLLMRPPLPWGCRAYRWRHRHSFGPSTCRSHPHRLPSLPPPSPPSRRRCWPRAPPPGGMHCVVHVHVKKRRRLRSPQHERNRSSAHCTYHHAL